MNYSSVINNLAKYSIEPPHTASILKKSDDGQNDMFMDDDVVVRTNHHRSSMDGGEGEEERTEIYLEFQYIKMYCYANLKFARPTNLELLISAQSGDPLSGAICNRYDFRRYESFQSTICIKTNLFTYRGRYVACKLAKEEAN